MAAVSAHRLPARESVPPDALDFLAAFEQARDDGLTYDEMIEDCAQELAALERWRAQVARSAG